MFNKRETSAQTDGSGSPSSDEPRLGVEAAGDKPARDVPPSGDRRGPAVIGP